MEPTTSSQEVLICQTCGDKGFTNAFVYCVKCLGFVIHRYCLHVMPNTYDEFVPWVCEDCQPPLSYPFTLHKLQPSLPQKLNATKSPPLKPVNRMKKRKSKPKKKTKKLIRDFPSKFSLKDASVKSDFLLKMTVLALQAPSKETVERKQSESLSGVKRKMSDSIEHSCCDSSCTDVSKKNKVGSHDKSHNQTPPKDHDDQAETTSKTHNNQEMRASKTGCDASQSGVPENNTQYIHYEPARPVLDPVWRGSFDITQTDYNLFEGFLGHLSNKACYKVCEEANVLPSLLSLQMHPKITLWPKSFLDSEPSDENIALYFFPGDTRNERDYEDLVSDMIDEELAMKASAKNADLLIFTSRVLPRPYWRFNGKNYLWGVFRGKKNDSNNSEVTSGKEILTTKMKTFESQSPQSPLYNYR